MLWKWFIDIGHTAVMLPLAAAIAGSLMAGRAWKLALCWSSMFGTGLVLVALSKIAFLGWQTGLPALAFKALSGHVLCASAVLPVLCFVVLQGWSAALRWTGVAAGALLALGIGALIVKFDFHSVSEVIASLVLGGSISSGYMWIATVMPAPRTGRSSLSFGIIVFVCVFALKPSVINHRLVDVALRLSGRDYPFEWHRRATCEAAHPSNG